MHEQVLELQRRKNRSANPNPKPKPKPNPNPNQVLNATMVEDPPGSRADVSTTATLGFAGGATARLTASALRSG